ncbi:storkhead-box protein 2 isoform X9 [Crotalus tigris]|uniref:storkhead-box protein 2 isoform X9 n=1 Tax=Crotalus tigris TaxID=88082 RepID=UPI00192F65BD|nr:storkhead-box protein 2 isoform X9 [Crotalus tigris]
MPRRLDKFLQIAPHSLAIVLRPCGGDGAAPPEQAARAQREGDAGGEGADRPGAGQGSRAEGEPAADSELGRHHIGYEIFADFKQGNMQHFWNKKVTAAVAETFFLGWIDEQVLLIQGKEEHLEALREGWMRRALKPPAGFQIKCLGMSAGYRQKSQDDGLHWKIEVIAIFMSFTCVTYVRNR